MMVIFISMLFKWKTFLRQKITLAPSAPTSMSGNERPRDLPSKNDAKPSLTPNTSHTMQLSNGDANSNGIDDVHMEIMESGGSGHPKHIAAQAQSKREQSRVTLQFGGFDSRASKKTGREDNFPSNKNHVTESKSVYSPPKINENTTTPGVLRYALHLRFSCPLPKKCSRSAQKCKSDSLSDPAMTNMDIEGERRFYLYNGLRVVFPQRHTDADEGKVLYIIRMCI